MDRSVIGMMETMNMDLTFDNYDTQKLHQMGGGETPVTQ